MADATISEVLVKLTADLSELKAEMQKGTRAVESSTKQMSTAAAAAGSSISGSMAALGLRLVGIVGPIEVARRAFGAFAESEVTVARLNATLNSMGRNVEVLSPLLQDIAQRSQAGGIFSDEEIIRGQEILATYATISDRQLPALTKDMLNLAAKTGDVSQAARLLGMASEGMTERFRRMGIVISEDAQKSGDFNRVLAELRPKIEGMHAALSATAEGSMKRFKNALDDTMESLGEMIAVPLVPFLDALRGPLAAITAMFHGVQASVELVAKTLFLTIAALSDPKNAKLYWEQYKKDANATIEETSAKINRLNERLQNPGGARANTEATAAAEKLLSERAKESEAAKALREATVAAERANTVKLLGYQSETTDDVRKQLWLRYQAALESSKAQADAWKKQGISDVNIRKWSTGEQKALYAKLQKDIADLSRDQTRATEDMAQQTRQIQAGMTDDVRQQADARYDAERAALMREREDRVRAGTWTIAQQEALDERLGTLEKQRVRDSRNAAQIQLDDWSNVYKQLGNAAARWLDDMSGRLTDFVLTGKISFRDFADSIIADLTRIWIKKQLVGIFGAGSEGGDIFGSIGGAVAGFLGGGSTDGAYGPPSGAAYGEDLPGFASGTDRAPVGRPYWVGEEGPELRVDSSPGRIIPNHELGSLGGGQTVNVMQTINVSAGVAQTVRAEMLGLLPSFKEQAKSGVLEAINSGGEFARAVGRRR